MAINSTFRKDLLESMNGDFLSSDDFTLNAFFTESGKRPKIEIVYSHDDTKFLTAEVYSNYVTVEMSPGRMLEIENDRLGKADELFDHILTWVEYIEAELKALPIVRAFNEHRDYIDTQIDVINELVKGFSNEKFSVDEAAELEGRISALEARFAKKLSEDIADKEKLEDEIKKLNKDIKFLKVQINNLTKGGWFKSFTVRTIGWMARNPKTMKALGGTILDVLPGEMKNSLPFELIASADEDQSTEQ
ncbi:hypothetical protein [Paenibacillus curdlanolyticus]|uniref:hypothetical protein n=1 Tax=Paenibacillus curdlanolyticus TaxID=59840 RepID=UPI000595035D|nr:hypothetical protein [Paenibacillus curdlanolyticus]